MHSGGKDTLSLVADTRQGRWPCRREFFSTRADRDWPGLCLESAGERSHVGAGMRQMTVCVVVMLGILSGAEARAQDERARSRGRDRHPQARLSVRPAARLGRIPRQLAVRAGRQRLVQLRERPVDAGPEGFQRARLCRWTSAFRSAAGPRPSSASTSTSPGRSRSIAISWTTIASPSTRPRGCRRSGSRAA